MRRKAHDMDFIDETVDEEASSDMAAMSVKN